MQRVVGLAAIGLIVLIAAEIVAFVLVAHWLGALLAVVLLLALSLVGGGLLRREGARAWRRLRAAGMDGRPMGSDVSQGLLGLLGGLLLAVPGFITGVLGLALLVPPVRRLAGVGMQRLAERQLSSAVAGDLFGPRRVRVRPGQPLHDPQPSGAQRGAPIEGEIIDPR
ncbi:hypothetical protein GCM10023322_14610 [Rugosimonospora acidiphila]|uniref:Uncharacterized protein n=1 Tax=Rugosimonospora acidiphila TaxID=556531 RepID=A0ABP9RNR2_9ACTN